MLFTHCSSEVEKDVDAREKHFSCSAEKVDGDNLIASGGVELKGSSARSKSKARSGKYSLKLSKTNPYGFTYQQVGLKKGQIIEASVWKNKDAEHGALVIAPVGNKKQYLSTGTVRKVKGDWGELKAIFIADRDYDSVAIYVYNLDAKPTYFDDFEVGVYQNTKKPEVKNGSQALHIEIPKSAMDSLDFFKSTALAQGVISDDLKDYVQATIQVNGEEAPIELRLKGDWTDHVESDKVSFRIKMGDGFAFQGLRTFSIQNPYNRGFMMEWFAHQMLENEDILTTRYEMIPVFINGENMGVYAMEEHFDKQLLEARKRREGPIMKFDESGVWQMHEYEQRTGDFLNAPVFPAAEISVFKKNRTRKNPALFAQFEMAQSHMESYRSGVAGVENYFDVESLAKYMAMMDLVNGKHGLIWHNQRFYFNPVTQLLEPIAYDCFMDANSIIQKHKLIGVEGEESNEMSLAWSVLKDKKVRDRYVHYLKKFSKKAYLEDVFSKFEQKVGKVEKLLQSEYPNESLDRSFFQFNRREIQKNIGKLKGINFNKKKEKGEIDPLPENIIFTDIALKVNLEKYNADSSVVMSAENFHSHAIEIIGYSVKPNKNLIIPIAPVKIDAYGKSKVRTINFPQKPRRIHYKAANCGEEIFKCNPAEWGRPSIQSKFGKHVGIQLVNKQNEVRLSGKINLNRSLVIPECKRLIIDPGTEITLQEGVFLLSYAPVFAKGTAEKPIRINGANEKAQGFVCLSREKSELAYVSFDQLGTVDHNNWRLTGAVTFYGAEINLRNCTFQNNHCEDGLNTIRCQIDLDKCRIENAMSDGFDADFCSGIVTNSAFFNTGNDCIDFSGSEITISKCEIKNAGDKGISGGEGSHLIVENCSITEATIAIASKDNSEVFVRNITISEANYSFAVYRKKPEYAPAKLIVESVISNEYNHLSMLEKGSKLIYLSKTYIGDAKLNIDSLYAEYQK